MKYLGENMQRTALLEKLEKLEYILINDETLSAEAKEKIKLEIIEIEKIIEKH